MRTGICMALGAVFILLFAAGCTQDGNTPSQSTGRAVFTMTDAAANMGTVTAVEVTVDSLQVQRADMGWTTVFSTPHTYDLMQLRASGNQSLLADVSLQNGTYGQIRMVISKVMVADSAGVHEAKLPSGELKIIGGFTVMPNSTAAVNLDFLADQSLHVTGDGQYILAPVVRMQTREGTQAITSSKDDVKTMGGQIKTDTTVGMDSDGNVGVGRRIAAGMNLSIRSDGKIMNERWSDTAPPTSNGGNAEKPTSDHSAAAPSREPATSIQPSCVGQSGADSGNCTYERALSAKDVSICASLNTLEARNTCIASYCMAERNYSACSRLTNNDDRLLCMYKCSPNQMK